MQATAVEVPAGANTRYRAAQSTLHPDRHPPVRSCPDNVWEARVVVCTTTVLVRCPRTQAHKVRHTAGSGTPAKKRRPVWSTRMAARKWSDNMARGCTQAQEVVERFSKGQRLRRSLREGMGVVGGRRRCRRDGAGSDTREACGVETPGNGCQPADRCGGSQRARRRDLVVGALVTWRSNLAGVCRECQGRCIGAFPGAHRGFGHPAGSMGVQLR